MTAPDIPTLIACATLLVLALLTPFLNAFLRKPKASAFIAEDSDADEAGAPSGQLPQFSIVLSVHDQAQELERNLPRLLSQQYPHYEVIVVDESSTDGTADTLKRLKAQYPHLYTTFIPESSHYLSRRKLALTLGIKAAKYPWIVFTDADCAPQGDQWLSTLARHCADSDLVCGYTGYAADTPDYWQFRRLLYNVHLLKHPYRYDGNNLAFRKALFIEHNGFLKNLKYLRGEYDFTVNENAGKRIAVMTAEDGRILQDCPTRKSWTNKHLYLMETRRHLTRCHLPRLIFNGSQVSLHLNFIIQLAALAYAAMTSSWLLLSVAACCLLLSAIIRVIIIRRMAKCFDVDLPLWKMPFFELRVAWTNLYFLVKHKRTDVYDFIRR